jgi:hypothetical protein
VGTFPTKLVLKVINKLVNLKPFNMSWVIQTKGDNNENGIICGVGEINLDEINSILKITKQTIVNVLQPNVIQGELEKTS